MTGLHRSLDAFGCVGDGIDETPAFAVACAWINAGSGRVVRIPTGVHLCDPGVIVVGDGTDAASSKHSGGGFIGESCSSYDPTQGTVIKARTAGETMVMFAGRISGVRFEHILVDCAGLAERGIDLYSVSQGRFVDFAIIEFTRSGLRQTCRAGGSIAWSSNNWFEQPFITSSVLTAGGVGVEITGQIQFVLDPHRNTWIGGVVQVNKAATGDPTYAMLCKCTDFTDFYKLALSVYGGGGQGYGLCLSAEDNPGFYLPQSLNFYGCSIKGVEVVGDIGRCMFINHHTTDGEGIPDHPNLTGFTDDGRFFGKWTLLRIGETRVLARLSAAQTIPAGPWTKVAFATEAADTFGEFDPVTNSWTATKDRRYRFRVGLLFTPSAATVGHLGLRLVRNGAEVERLAGVATASTQFQYLTGMHERDVLAGEVYTVEAFAAPGAVIDNAATRCFFEITPTLT